MPKAIDLSGKRFGRLVVVSRDPSDSRYWHCVCDCGAPHRVYGYNMTSGKIVSCGCKRREGPRVRHGMCRTRTYGAWSAMKRRSLSKTATRYNDWGGRGITLYKRWHVFDNFLSDMGECPEGYSIERRDNARGYSKENCYWATPVEQARNTRRNVSLTMHGRTQLLCEWADELGLKRTTISQRLVHGWSVEHALTTPVLRRPV